MNGWKLVPVEPTAEMAEAGCQGYMNADGSAWVMHLSSMDHAYCAMLAAAPVPPAGEVEVLVVVTLGSFSSEELGEIDVEPQMKTLERLQQQLVTNEDVSLELVDIAHVTRLNAELKDFRESLVFRNSLIGRTIAERDALKAEVERLKVACSKEFESVQILDNELIKARESMLDVISNLGEFCCGLDSQEQVDYISSQLDRLAHQSAPAAKGDSDE